MEIINLFFMGLSSMSLLLFILFLLFLIITAALFYRSSVLSHASSLSGGLTSASSAVTWLWPLILTILFLLMFIFSLLFGTTPPLPTDQSNEVASTTNTTSTSDRTTPNNKVTPTAKAPVVTTATTATTVTPIEETIPKVYKKAEIVVVELTAKNYEFSRKEIRVKPGVKIQFKLTSLEGVHNLLLKELDVQTQEVGPGQTETAISATTTPGVYKYYDSQGMNRSKGMEGTLIVE